MWHLQGKLSNTLGAQLNALLDPLTKPRSTTVEDENGNTTPIPDQRPYGQRLHDALDEACARLLKIKDQPSSGGTPTSVIVTITLDDLLANTGLAETSDGIQLSPDQLLRIAEEAEIWPTVINHHNVPLAVGRTRRIATPGQTMALHIRDGGCSFPGCIHPPSYCDRHHILDWIHGGPTDLDNLTLRSADTTTPTSCRKAGPAASTPTNYPNGHHPGGSTNTNAPKSTPASDASTPNANNSNGGDNHPTPHERPKFRPRSRGVVRRPAWTRAILVAAGKPRLRR
jgi:hypothetical protein